MTKKKQQSTTTDADRRLNQADRLGKILRILQLIQSRGRWNVAEIAREIEVVERTIYRYFNILELAGVPYYYDRRARSYRVRPGWFFPVLNLSGEELVDQAVATAVASVPGIQASQGARSTTRKIAETDEAKQELLADAEMLIQVLNLKLSDHSRHGQVIRTAQRALLERKQLQGKYASPYQDAVIDLRLHPFRLCLIGQAWYLIARTEEKQVPKTYRITRFQQLRMQQSTALVPQEFDLTEYLGNAWGIYRGDTTYDVEVQFSPAAAPLVTETLWHRTQQVEWHKDGSATLCFQVDGLQEIIWWLLGWSGRVTIVRPKELRDLFVEHLQQAIQMHQK